MYDNITVKQSNNTNTITFHVDKINILNSTLIKNSIIELMETNDDLILDFTNVRFIDSTGFLILHKIKIKCFTDNINIDYINISDDLKELFDLIRLS